MTLLPPAGAWGATDDALRFASVLATHKARQRRRIHSFHRWYGKLIPAIPSAAMEMFTKPGDLVLDPFCGSGTVLVEARFAARASRGHDVSPLATLLSRVKTRAMDPASLLAAAMRMLARVMQPSRAEALARIPALPNREHFYPDPVALELTRLYLAAAAEEDEAAREFLTALVSAINRDVSNADTHHVFPGVSKRMRALISEGWIGDPHARFGRALKARLAAAAELHDAAMQSPEAVVVSSPLHEDPPPPGSCALVVSNPPYVSSIRYVETFKLEAWWLGLVASRTDIIALDARCLGSERVDETAPASDEAALAALPAPCCRELIVQLAARGERRMAEVVKRYINGLGTTLSACATALAPGGHAVIKLAPSRLRGVVIPTPLACAEILASQGCSFLGTVEDSYNQHSRTLTTARNWYSGRMDADSLLLFRKGARA